MPEPRAHSEKKKKGKNHANTFNIIILLLKFIMDFSILPILKVYAMVSGDHNFSLFFKMLKFPNMLQMLKDND